MYGPVSATAAKIAALLTIKRLAISLDATVTDPFILHQDRPALLGRLLGPVNVGYLLVGRDSSEAAIEKESKRLLPGWQHG
jgi:hypothetical protein